MMSAALIANPARDADIQIQIEIGASLIQTRREAMRDATGQLRAMFAHDPHEILVRIALMQEHGLADLRGQLQLRLERLDLRLVRREVAKVVEATLTDRDHFGPTRQFVECLQLRGIELHRMMRMDAGGTAHLRRMLLHQSDRGLRARKRTAGDQHASHAHVGRALDDCVAILIEAVVRQIQPDIQQRRRRRKGGKASWINRHLQRLCYLPAMNCSAWMGRLLLPWWLAVAASASAGSTAEFDDLVARLQFSFFTGDSRALEQMLTELDRFEVDAPLAAIKSYQLAYGEWKLAQLLGEPQDERARAATRSSASKAAKTCVQHARAAIERDPRMAEIYAIEAACDTYQPGSTKRGSASCMRSKSMRTALTLGAENPRVLFINAWCSPDAEGDPAAIERWRAVVARFEAAPPSQPGKPDWGHAEALTLLGESYLKRGEMVAARDVLERALVLAPDYRQAQKLLQAAANRPR